MASADQSISLMDGTYFVGRKEILDWVNSVCGLNLAKVEQTCTGAVACQLLDAIYPGKVPMSKVDWSANKDYEYINNYKVLQKCFTNLKIDKHIEVDRLVRGKYQDNLEFMQWFKKFYELNASGQPYEPLSQREKGKGGSAYTSKYGGSGSGSAPSPTTSSNVPVKKPVTASSRMFGTKTAKPPAPPTAVSRTSKSSGLSSKASLSTNNSQEKDKELEELNTQCEALTNENGELRSTVEALEKERDFYYHKLRDIEVLLQSLENPEGNKVAQDILKILYATGEGESEPMEDVALAGDEMH